MKKLKSKVFFTISTILTIFVFAVFLISNARTYSEKKENVKNVLDKMIELSDNANSNNVFMDFTVYNIILDENGMYKETVSHTYEDVIDIVKIKNIANKIIKYHHSKYYIGNLYNAKYSYAFTDNNSLILMDNSEVKNTLTKTLITTSIIFIFLESCVILTSFILTSWITEPVNESFDKQKRFIADASHELKTPLTVINASVEAYYNDKNEKWIHNIKEETEKMNKLVIELLDLAKIEANKKILMKEENLSKLTENEILTYESLFYEKKIKLKYNIKKNIKYTCNGDLIRQLLGILIDNSIKHTNENGNVTVNLYKSNKDIILEVKNDGDEIKKEDEQKIFERFYKIDESRNRNENRYGLGLAIAKDIVEKHNAKISANSKKGITTFKVTF
ncbi:MAG: HAMP domain-containing sensor histidine kinase [Bacilli bacterium]|nr:HAMP domain-containing sensor histidine kinase [Bacilli bacterium]